MSMSHRQRGDPSEAATTVKLGECESTSRESPEPLAIRIDENAWRSRTLRRSARVAAVTAVLATGSWWLARPQRAHRGDTPRGVQSSRHARSSAVSKPRPRASVRRAAGQSHAKRRGYRSHQVASGAAASRGDGDTGSIARVSRASSSIGNPVAHRRSLVSRRAGGFSYLGR